MDDCRGESRATEQLQLLKFDHRPPHKAAGARQAGNARELYRRGIHHPVAQIQPVSESGKAEKHQQIGLTWRRQEQAHAWMLPCRSRFRQSLVSWSMRFFEMDR
jgi:hypothetical protein